MLMRPRVGRLHQQSPSVEGLKPGNYLASFAPAEIHLHQPSQPVTWSRCTFLFSYTDVNGMNRKYTVRTCTYVVLVIKGTLPCSVELGRRTNHSSFLLILHFEVNLLLMEVMGGQNSQSSFCGKIYSKAYYEAVSDKPSGYLPNFQCKIPSFFLLSLHCRSMGKL